MSGGSGLTLDIDGTLIEADKGDAQMTYKDFRGYHPLVGGCVELGLFAGSRFQHGNAAPKKNSSPLSISASTICPAPSQPSALTRLPTTTR